MINKNFKFTLNVSHEGYTDKKEASCCLSSKGAEAIGKKKMCFFEETLTVNEFLDKAKKGHSFCNLYRFESGKKYWYTNKKGQKFLSYPTYTRDSKTATKGGLKLDFKRDEYFTGSQVIFIDIDRTKYTDIKEYIKLLTFKPTMVYMSYSDNKDKGGLISRRFHLCYVFDSILDASEFKKASHYLSEMLEVDTNEKLDDDCGKRLSQYMNGCYNNKENYKTNIIYNIDNIIELYNKNYNDDIYTTLNIEMENEATYVDDVESEIEFDENILELWDSLKPEDFMKSSSWVSYLNTTEYLYRTSDEWFTNWQKVDNNYFCLFTKFRRVSEGKYVCDKVVDGSGRRKDLFMRMCLRRLMDPNISVRELTFNTIMDILRQYDNSDGVLSSEFIRKNIKASLDLSIEEIEEKYSGEIKYLKETFKPKKGIIFKNRESRTLETTYEILDLYYNVNLSVEENIKSLADDGIYYKKSTIYNYLKNRGISANQDKMTDEEILELIDFNLSIRENFRIFKDNNFTIGRNRLSSIYNKNKENNKNNTEEDIVHTLNIEMENEATPFNSVPTFPDYSTLEEVEPLYDKNGMYEKVNLHLELPNWDLPKWGNPPRFY